MWQAHVTCNVSSVPLGCLEPVQRTDYVQEHVLAATQWLRTELCQPKQAHRQDTAQADNNTQPLQGCLAFCTKQLTSGRNERAQLIDKLHNPVRSRQTR